MKVVVFSKYDNTVRAVLEGNKNPSIDQAISKFNSDDYYIVTLPEEKAQLSDETYW